MREIVNIGSSIQYDEKEAIGVEEICNIKNMYRKDLRGREKQYKPTRLLQEIIEKLKRSSSPTNFFFLKIAL